MKPLLSYIVVRRDLPLAQIVVQACHAAMEMGTGQNACLEPVHLAVVTVENQDELMKAVKGLEMDGCTYELFEEPDDDMGYTALCTYPSTLRNNKLSKLPLL